jgi:hypothetical protein
MPEEHPLQPLVNVISQQTCAIKELIARLGGTSPSDSTVIPIIIQPLKGEVANIKAVIVATVPTLVVARNRKRANISMVNNGAATIFIGPDQTVTTDTGGNPGYPILAGGEINNDTYIGAFWAVVAAGTIRLGVWEEETP